MFFPCLKIVSNSGCNSAGCDADRDSNAGISADLTEGRSEHRTAKYSPRELACH